MCHRRIWVWHHPRPCCWLKRISKSCVVIMNLGEWSEFACDRFSTCHIDASYVYIYTCVRGILFGVWVSPQNDHIFVGQLKYLLFMIKFTQRIVKNHCSVCGSSAKRPQSRSDFFLWGIWIFLHYEEFGVEDVVGWREKAGQGFIMSYHHVTYRRIQVKDGNWAIYSDLSRGHPKWWFSKGIPSKMALNQVKDL